MENWKWTRPIDKDGQLLYVVCLPINKRLAYQPKGQQQSAMEWQVFDFMAKWKGI